MSAARGASLAAPPMPGAPSLDNKNYAQQDELEIFAGRRTVSASTAPRRASLSPGRPGPSSGQIATPTSADSMTSHTSFLPQSHHANDAHYPMDGPSNLGGWPMQQQQQQMPMSSYPTSDQWYRQGVYPQPHTAAVTAWAEPHQTPPHAPVPQPHESMMQVYQNQLQMSGNQQTFRRPSHNYPGPLTYQGVHTPYEPPPELVGLGLASREGNLDARWTSLMHESGFLDVNFRT